MNRDRIKGKAKQLSGRVQRKLGAATGNRKAQARGALRQAEGTVQNAWGKAKDEAELAGRRATAPRRAGKPRVTTTTRTKRRTTTRIERD